MTSDGDLINCDFPLMWHPSGTIAYCITTLGNVAVQIQDFDPVTGGLTSLTTFYFSAFLYDGGVQVDPSGRFLYLNAVSPLPIYVIDPATGNLESEPSTVSPGVGFVFVTQTTN